MQLLTPVAPTGRGPREFGLLKEAKRLTGVIRRGWWVIGISILICLLAAITYLAVAQRVYQAEAQLLVLQQGGRPLNVANTDPSRLMEGTEDLTEGQTRGSGKLLNRPSLEEHWLTTGRCSQGWRLVPSHREIMDVPSSPDAT